MSSATEKANAQRWLPVEERFWLKVSVAGAEECWNWIGTTDRKGYGRFDIKGKHVMAHRWSYEFAIGPIPEGLVIDHLCRNTSCVNPEHLEPVTNAENVRRGEPANRTHCPQGHEYTPENTYLRKDRKNRHCRECHLAAAKKRDRTEENARARAKRAEARKAKATAESVLLGLRATRDADQAHRLAEALRKAR